MNSEQKEKLSLLLQVLGLAEEPMGIFYSDEKPTNGFSPRDMDLPTREKEQSRSGWLGPFGAKIFQNR